MLCAGVRALRCLEDMNEIAHAPAQSFGALEASFVNHIDWCAEQ